MKNNLALLLTAILVIVASATGFAQGVKAIKGEIIDVSCSA